MDRPHWRKDESVQVYLSRMDRYCDVLEKALDRACDQLQHLILGTKPVVQYTPEEWKEILMDDKLWENVDEH